MYTAALTECSAQVDEHKTGSEARELACCEAVLRNLSIAGFDCPSREDLPGCHGL